MCIRDRSYRDEVEAREVSQSKERQKVGWGQKMSDEGKKMIYATKKWKIKMEKKAWNMKVENLWRPQMSMKMSPNERASFISP